MRTQVAVAPDNDRASWLKEAVRSGGGDVVELHQAESLIWTTISETDKLGATLEEFPNIRWVQLPFAGVDTFTHLMDDGRTWTCAKGVYSEPVAELAFSLLLAGFRGVGTYARRDSWMDSDADELGRNLSGANLTVLGAGGITTSFLRMVSPFEPQVTVVRRHADRAIEGAQRTVGLNVLHDVLASSDAVILALALVPDTVGVIDAAALGALPDHAWVVNIARGAHIVTDDLVSALDRGELGGAALDVTDPEPLPDGHRLWSFDNVIITPHVGNTPQMEVPLLSQRVSTNVRRFIAGEELVGLVSPDLGY